MSSRPGSAHQDRRPSGQRVASNSTEEVEREDNIAGEEDEGPRKEKPSLPDRSKKPPAYVAPIPKISSIPPISPTIPTRPKLPPFVGSFLMGKQVDESGDIVDDKTGQVLARAGGDLPSIVGRRVSNRQGDILGDNGELLGYVADIEIERKGSAQSQYQPQSPRSLFDIMSRSNASLMVDGAGNILDSDGNVVGKFHDNNNPMHREARERERETQSPETHRAGPALPPRPAQEGPQPQPAPEEQQQPRPRRTEEERRANAEAWRKEKPGESPSDIFLDVKSTTEGIQLTIRIPTVFGGQQVKPNISFS